MSKSYKNKATAFFVLATLVLAISFPAIALTAKAITVYDLTAQPFFLIRSPQAGAAPIGYSSQQNGTTSLAYPSKQNGDPTGFSPSQIEAAYNLPITGGTGTVAIIDAYYDPNIASDLATFDSEYGLPAPKLTVYNMGTTQNSGWAVETSLDVEWVHAIAPTASILLVEASSSSMTALLSAISYATSQSGVVAVSMSWGTSEFSGETTYDSYLTSTVSPNAVFFAASGDGGAGSIWPSASPNVISVGGTTLNTATTPPTESAWSDSGGGISAYEPEPTWQTNYGLIYNGRSTPDVSFDANPSTGVSIYDSTPYEGMSGWLEVGGTSVGAQCWAGIQALGLTASHVNFYGDGSSPSSNYFRDVPTGSNGYPANSGYDLSTGLGSPITTDFTPQDFSISATPNLPTIYVQSPVSTTIITTVTVTAFSTNTGTITVDLTAAPPSEAPTFGAALTPYSSVTLAPGASATDTLTVTVPAGTTHGTYLVTITGTVGTLSQSTAFSVKARDITISASPASLNIRSGSSETSTVTVTPVSGFSGNVQLTTTVPSGITASFSPNPVDPTTALTVPGVVTAVTPATSTLTIHDVSAATGTYTITITGTGPGNGGTIPVETTTITVTVSSTTHHSR